ncbi:hypothetical protein MVEN_00166800 [Mycena venus]|uniref:Uncharacterized protein n=1 Tax=Mycena venus TaxID=2733690 RepID=A0A8H6YXT2_9AGAR|nr:hypothetical protein MVEN_00166800 [Mycena venus]
MSGARVADSPPLLHTNTTMSQQSLGVSMFNECRNVTISGGNFTVVDNASRRSLEEDYRSIRLEDLNLVSHTETENIVRSRQTRVVIGTRKMYYQ